jgi:putative inorganic carbon (HCO3(-)) transporter
MSLRDRLIDCCSRVIRWGATAFAGASTVSITATQAAYYSAFAAWLARGFLRRRLIARPTSVDRAVGFFLLAGILSTIASDRPVESLVGMKKLLLIPIIYVIADQAASKERARALAWLFIGFAAAVSLYGIVHHLLSGDPRLMATQALPTTAGGLLMMASCLALPLLVFGASGIERLLFLPTCGVLFLALIMTKTRGAWFGLLAGVATMAALKGWKYVVPFVLMVAVGFFLLPHDLSERLMVGFRSDYEGVQERLAMWKASLDIIRDYPVTGVGLVDLQQVHALYSRPGLTKIHGHMHNNLLQVAVTTGIFGLTTFLYLVFTLVREQFSAYCRTVRESTYPRALALGCIGASVGFITHGLFECTLCDAEIVMVFWLVVGMSLGIKGGIDCALD